MRRGERAFVRFTPGGGGGAPGVSRGSQSRQYQSELYLHAGCKEMQCKHVSGSVGNRHR